MYLILRDEKHTQTAQMHNTKGIDGGVQNKKYIGAKNCF